MAFSVWERSESAASGVCLICWLFTCLWGRREERGKEEGGEGKGRGEVRYGEKEEGESAEGGKSWRGVVFLMIERASEQS